MDYIAEARLTLSPAWHGEKVSKANFTQRLNAAIDAANKLDMVKKTLFYGRDNNLEGGLGQVNLRCLPAMMNMEDAVAIDMIHGIIGMFTEAGELLEALRDTINGDKPFDMVNINEEVGDSFWYQAIIAYRAGFTFDQSQMVNIAKLRRRFPDRFTEYDANNRNLAEERDVLEGELPLTLPVERGGGALALDVAEQALPVNHRTRKMPGERNQDGDALEAQKPR